MALDWRNGQDEHFNTCKLEQSEGKEDQQDLYHEVQNTNQISMLLALPEAQESHN